MSTERQRQQQNPSAPLVAPSPSIPTELYPIIFDFLQHRSKDLSRLTSVNQLFNLYSIPLLYQRLFLRDQSKIYSVFKSLYLHPHLLRHVQILELKGFPFGLPAEQLEELEHWITKSVERMVNLRELSWTRSGSFLPRTGFQLSRNNRVLQTIFDSLLHLESLSITGDSRTYSPYLLLEKLRPEIKLKQLSVQSPDRNMVKALPKIAERLGEDLESLTLSSDSSTLINDQVLVDISKYLTRLEELNLVGYRGVTNVGIGALMESSQDGISELAIEGLGIRPETFPTLYPFVSSLRKLSLTHPRSSISSPQHFYSSLASLLESLTLLTEFTLYVPSKTNIGILTGEEETENIPNQEKEQDSQEPRLPASFLKRLMESVGNKLQRLRICGIAISNDQLGLICQSCIELNDLVIQLFEGDKSTLYSHLSKLPKLRFLHILSNASTELDLDEEHMRQLAEKCNPSIENVGFRHRVWIVHRIPLTEEEKMENLKRISSEKLDLEAFEIRECRVELRKWDLASGRWPEVVLVVRA